MWPNDHHQRCEPAAEDFRIVTELNGRLASAAWVWLCFPIRLAIALSRCEYKATAQPRQNICARQRDNPADDQGAPQAQRRLPLLPEEEEPRGNQWKYRQNQGMKPMGSKNKHGHDAR